MSAVKKKKKRKGLKLVALLSVCVLFLGGFLVLRNINKKNEQDKEQSETKATKEVVVSVPSDTVTKISITSRDISGKYNRSFVYNKEDATWLCETDNDIPMKQTLVKGLLSNATSVTAINKISDDFEKYGADYGLKDPAHTIELTLDDGSKKTLYIGDKAFTGDYYYFAVSGDNRVFQIGPTLYNYTKRSFNEFINAAGYPYFETANIVSVDYKDKDTDLLIYYNPEDLLLVDAMSISMWYFPAEDEGRYISAGYDQGNTFSEAVTGLTLTSCIEYKATQEELEKYGLLNPQARLTVDYVEKTTKVTTDEEGKEVEETISTPKKFTLLIGNEFTDNDNPYFYACFEGENIVYKANGKSGVKYLLEEYNMQAMLNLWPCQINIACVDSFIVNMDGNKTTCSINRTTTTNDKGEEVEEMTFFVNGKEIASDPFRTFFSKLIMLAADRAIDKTKVIEDAEVVLSYEFKTIYEDEPTRQIKLLTYGENDNYYQLSINGEILYLVSRADAKEIIQVINDFRKTY